MFNSINELYEKPIKQRRKNLKLVKVQNENTDTSIMVNRRNSNLSKRESNHNEAPYHTNNSYTSTNTSNVQFIHENVFS